MFVGESPSTRVEELKGNIPSEEATVELYPHPIHEVRCSLGLGFMKQLEIGKAGRLGKKDDVLGFDKIDT